MKTIIILASLISLAYALSHYEVLSEEWQSWKLLHKKSYLSEEEEGFRMSVYLENKAKIAKHNQRAHRGEETFFMKMNHLGDLLHTEVANAKLGVDMGLLKKSRSKANAATFIAPEHLSLPTTVDWRSKGAVAEVKNQGMCGSCWAFSATGALEGQNFRKTGKLVSLSEQNLVDCSYKYGNHGCEGGLMDQAFQYIKDNHGVDTEDSYPYEGDEGKCRFTKKNIGASDAGFVDIPSKNTDALTAAVASIGPISVAIDASPESFQFYAKGVWTVRVCSEDHLNHGVLLVGYGTENGNDYWLVKNSWGTKWGDSGYIKLNRNETNMCGIATMASYPLV